MPSTVIHKMEYDAQAEVLRVTFLSGQVYEYFPVPPLVFADMRAATSKGRFLNKYIKGKFSVAKVS